MSPRCRRLSADAATGGASGIELAARSSTHVIGVGDPRYVSDAFRLRYGASTSVLHRLERLGGNLSTHETGLDSKPRNHARPLFQ